jgi:hypothetical protein
MLPHDAKTVVISGLFVRDKPSFIKHFWQIPVKAEVRSQDGKGMCRSQFQDKFKGCNSIEDQSGKNYDQHKSFRYVFSKGEQAVPEIQKRFMRI